MTNTTTLNRVERACAELRRDGHHVTFTAVAAATGLAGPPSTATPPSEQPSKNTAAAPSPAALWPASPKRSPPSRQPSMPLPNEYDATRNGCAAWKPNNAETVNRPTHQPGPD